MANLKLRVEETTARPLDRSRGAHGFARTGLAIAVLAGGACSSSAPPAPVNYGSFVPPSPSLRRLTQAQYQNSIHDIFGDAILVSGGMEPDTASSDFLVVGAGRTSISARGVEQYETLGSDIARQVMTSSAKAGVLTCAPSGPADTACAKAAIATLGARLWRRALTDEETSALATLVTTAATTLGTFEQGMEFGISALLQSPNFLFRAELGTPDPAQPGTARYSGSELAARLSFFLWNGPPDDALATASSDGTLLTDAGIAAQVTRMLASPKARRGLDDFVTEWLALYQLDDLVKDPKVYTQISTDLGPAARQETLLDVERMVFDLDGDFRDLYTTRETFVNHKLASIYSVRAPVPTIGDFGLVTLRSSQPRRGLLGQLSILAEYAHPTSSSPTLRGKFVRGILLCQPIPPPPVNVNTALPQASASAPTMRQRLSAHAQDPFCASCHNRMDPIGLGFENFDGLGVYRTTESHVDIDASGTLDGAPFKDLGDLAQVVHDHPSAAGCFTERVYRYAAGHEEQAGEAGEIQRLTDGYKASGYRMKKLLASIATSDAFRRTGLPEAP